MASKSTQAPRLRTIHEAGWNFSLTCLSVWPTGVALLLKAEVTHQVVMRLNLRRVLRGHPQQRCDHIPQPRLDRINWHLRQARSEIFLPLADSASSSGIEIENASSIIMTNSTASIPINHPPALLFTTDQRPRMAHSSNTDRASQVGSPSVTPHYKKTALQ